jgi:hypothetical protein
MGLTQEWAFHSESFQVNAQVVATQQATAVMWQKAQAQAQMFVPTLKTQHSMLWIEQQCAQPMCVKRSS